ncbi:MAG: WxcM-like domain-containing protein [Chloroherpetonaceae bacterium]|nr:WxcM-like domain-containing protein [Chthonomonadaceae bacterium]MDW8208051.1 WxcM-like domain-containing protein [Chloroherpetonaceae bacterium]
MTPQEIEAALPGVRVFPLMRYTDARGWLTELFREDELPGGFRPRMGYISLTHPGITRGPHEHRTQTDGFVFLHGRFRIYLWENRPGRPRVRCTLEAGEANPIFLLVPPGVVHAYRNIGDTDAFILNFPDQLYAGWGRREPVDEIRYEETDSEFQL